MFQTGEIHASIKKELGVGSHEFREFLMLMKKIVNSPAP
jgi:hypothetical protein